MPKIGEPAPDFALPNQDGQTVRLSDLRGKKVVLFAFPKAGTPGCTTQACTFRDFFPAIQTANAVVLGISTDSQDALKQWKNQQNLQYDLLSDIRQTVLKQWEAGGPSFLGLVNIPLAKRSVWVIDEDGKVILAEVGIGPKDSVDAALKVISEKRSV